MFPSDSLWQPSKIQFAPALGRRDCCSRVIAFYAHNYALVYASVMRFCNSKPLNSLCTRCAAHLHNSIFLCNQFLYTSPLLTNLKTLMNKCKNEGLNLHHLFIQNFEKFATWIFTFFTLIFHFFTFVSCSFDKFL